MPDPARILLVTKPRYIGDTVIATPAMRAVALRYPDTEIDLLTGAGAAEVIEGCPYLHSVEVIPRGGRRRPWTLWRQAARLRRRRYETAVLFDRSLRSAFLCFLAGIPRRVGFAVEFRGLLLTERVRYDRSLPELDCLLAVAEEAGAAPDGRRLELWVGAEEARAAMERYGLAGRAVVALAPAANEPHLRAWPPEHFAAVGQALAGRGMTPVLLGAPNEIAAVEAVHTRLPNAVNLAGRTPIRDALRLIAASSLFVSGEIGLSHCAVALGTPCVTIHGPTKVARWGHENERSVPLWVPAPNDNPTPEQIRECLRKVTPEEVLAAAGRVMRKVDSVAP